MGNRTFVYSQRVLASGSVGLALASALSLQATPAFAREGVSGSAPAKGSEPAASDRREFRFILGGGAQWLDMDALNASLRQIGAKTYKDAFIYRPASVSAELLEGSNGFGFEFRSLDNPNSDEIQSGYQNNITYFALLLHYTRVVYENSFLRLYPGVGLGFSEMHNVIQPHAPSGIPFEEVLSQPRQSSHLVTNAYIATGYLEAEYPFWLWGGSSRYGGLSLGARGGYVLELAKSASEQTWVQHGQQVLDGPEVSFSGWFAQVNLALMFGG